jgi:hypothetical protein
MPSQKDSMNSADWAQWMNVDSVPSAGRWGTKESPIQCHRIDPKGNETLGDVHDKGGMLLNIAEYYKLPIDSLVLFDDTSYNLDTVEGIGAFGVSTSNCPGGQNGYCDTQCGLTNSSLQAGLAILARLGAAERAEVVRAKEEQVEDKVEAEEDKAVKDEGSKRQEKLELEEVTPGDGNNFPKAGDKLRMHYVGKLLKDGSQFDSSRDRGQPFEFTIGVGQVIKGWDEGIMKMSLGERGLLKIPVRTDHDCALTRTTTRPRTDAHIDSHSLHC